MKKLLWLIVCLMTMVTFTSCRATYLATAKYEVCYPDGTRSYEDSAKITSLGEPMVLCFSRSGTNYISVVSVSTDINGTNTKKIEKFTHIVSSTAPMRLVDYKIEKLKREIQKIHYNW